MCCPQQQAAPNRCLSRRRWLSKLCCCPSPQPTQTLAHPQHRRQRRRQRTFMDEQQGADGNQSDGKEAQQLAAPPRSAYAARMGHDHIVAVDAHVAAPVQDLEAEPCKGVNTRGELMVSDGGGKCGRHTAGSRLNAVSLPTTHPPCHSQKNRPVRLVSAISRARKAAQAPITLALRQLHPVVPRWGSAGRVGRQVGKAAGEASGEAHEGA